MPSGLFYLKSLDKFISYIVFIISMFAGISELNANSTDPDQTSISVVISVYTVCQCPFYGMLGLNGLKCMNDSFYLEVIFLN